LKALSCKLIMFSPLLVLALLCGVHTIGAVVPLIEGEAYSIFLPFKGQLHSHGLLAPPEKWVNEYANRIVLLRNVLNESPLLGEENQYAR
jgi:hypothetical protein